jgi:hypothetical protein
MNGCEKRLTVRVAYGVLDRTLCRCRYKGTTFKLQPNSLFDDGTGPGLEPVGGEFQPSFETVHPGGGAHLFSVLHSILSLKSGYAPCRRRHFTILNRYVFCSFSQSLLTISGPASS